MDVRDTVCRLHLHLSLTHVLKTLLWKWDNLIVLGFGLPTMSLFDGVVVILNCSIEPFS